MRQSNYIYVYTVKPYDNLKIKNVCVELRRETNWLIDRQLYCGSDSDFEKNLANSGIRFFRPPTSITDFFNKCQRWKTLLNFCKMLLCRNTFQHFSFLKQKVKQGSRETLTGLYGKQDKATCVVLDFLKVKFSPSQYTVSSHSIIRNPFKISRAICY
jgi:hypothetical protein